MVNCYAAWLLKIGKTLCYELPFSLPLKNRNIDLSIHFHLLTFPLTYIIASLLCDWLVWKKRIDFVFVNIKCIRLGESLER